MSLAESGDDERHWRRTDVVLASVTHGPQCEHGNEAGVAISISLAGSTRGRESSVGCSPRCPWPCLSAVSEAPVDISRDTSIMPKATYFRVESKE